MWPFFSCLAAKTFIQPLSSYLIMTAGAALSSAINKCCLAPLAHLSRIQRSLFPAHCCQCVIPPYLPLWWHPLSLQTYVAHTCFHSPSSPALSLICHSAWKGWFSPSAGPWCQSSLTHFSHPQTSYPRVYPIPFLMLFWTSLLSHSPQTLPKSNSPLWRLVSHSDPHHLLSCLHSCLSYTFLALT